jgi:hypothetical protein
MPILPNDIGHDLPEMGMIGWAELVFDDDHSAFNISGENVDREVSDCKPGRSAPAWSAAISTRSNRVRYAATRNGMQRRSASWKI